MSSEWWPANRSRTLQGASFRVIGDGGAQAEACGYRRSRWQRRFVLAVLMPRSSAVREPALDLSVPVIVGWVLRRMREQAGHDLVEVSGNRLVGEP